MRCVRVERFYTPLLEEGLEDTSEMISQHNNERIADYTRQVLIIRPIGAKLIPVMEFSREYQPVVKDRFKQFICYHRKNISDDACSSDSEHSIDVEKAAEKGEIGGQYMEESSSELEDD
ncbi:hypothetical protein BLNAU_19693 [Blattamonas nauphoetae]|uniref:Uncharacterized protein n=1 Tax=Blattamonas nauphoetae TaxID=2049346 RepID=A0ABQ9X0S3_9EUKA|nr:hypothetical protein BLNAU_19693 [Blattamonas nauphoetae]